MEGVEGSAEGGRGRSGGGGRERREGWGSTGEENAALGPRRPSAGRTRSLNFRFCLSTTPLSFWVALGKLPTLWNLHLGYKAEVGMLSRNRVLWLGGWACGALGKARPRLSAR